MPAYVAAKGWLSEQFTALLGPIFETMTGDRAVTQWDLVAAAPSEPMLRWRQPFTGVPGVVWVCATELDWTTTGGHVLQAAGITDGDTASLKSTYLEIVGQALAGLEQALTGYLGREVVRAGGEESSVGFSDAEWISVRLTLGAAAATWFVGFDAELIAAIPEPEPEVEPQADAVRAGDHASAEMHAPENSRTFDLLLDVELPVSVSFGRAHVALKEVLKLTTGSVVELNRAVVDPVEVIVNNCVIARGEVVVVEGNFGVRIQEVISRQERLRTLN